MNKPLVLCIMDGVGINEGTDNNAIATAKMPFFDSLLKKYPHSQLEASGVAVGLPHNVMGNSEVGHITIGAGRVVNQFLRRFQLEDWNKNKKLQNFIKAVQESGGIVHVSGLFSDGRVHSDVNDILEIVKYILKSGLRVCLHVIADGRDTPPKSAKKYVDMVNAELAQWFSEGRVFWGTMSGRYYAMDRNNNVDRTEIAVDAIVHDRSKYFADSIDDAINNAYMRGETDEFIYPTVISGTVPVTKKDGFVFGNYRSDRARQIMRDVIKTGVCVLCFSQYGEGLNEMCPALIDDVEVKNTLGDVLAQNGLSQLRIAETEKYNHVTYFMDAERNIDYPGETKMLIPSPNVATFDLQPEMAAVQITDTLLENLGNFDVIIMNYANGDMVGHTGDMNATVHAMEALDAQLARFVPVVLEMGGVVLITSAHGNAEQMWAEKNRTSLTSHTTNPVNFIVVSNAVKSVQDGSLADIAPTVLGLLGIKPPKDMTGHNLIK